MAERTCGTCTLCCKLVGVAEIQKPTNQWCTHCDPGKGCRVYDDQPASCAAFECFWLSNLWIHDRLRPDRSKVVLEGMMSANAVLAMCDPGYPAAWRDEPMHSFLERLVRRMGIAVIVAPAGSPEPDTVMLPKGRSVDDLQAAILEYATATVQRYADQEGIDIETARQQMGAWI